MSDQRLATVLSAIHQKPGNDWKVADLAQIAGMSRTAFTMKFNDILEMTPMQYITQWRMHLAKDMLNGCRNSVMKVAVELGYKTEGAFRRAFKRVSGVGPGKLSRDLATVGQGADS